LCPSNPDLDPEEKKENHEKSTDLEEKEKARGELRFGGG